MTDIKKKKIYSDILKLAPLILLFVSVLNEFDFNYLKYFSFNFPFILIFYWSLKKSESLGYGYIFLAGLINDVVIGFPMGISSLSYLLICGFAAYLRNITLRPSLIKDWFFFLFTILVINSLNYTFLYMFFLVDFNYLNLFYNNVFTFIFYLLFANLFSIYQKAFFKETND
tara:strand:- start:105 stop:617 length:513 start_codon:yes stop_codon:yes gene_type:complete